jgi:hypothetical protein
LKRPEVTAAITAAIIATDAHVGPLLAACERRLDLFIEKASGDRHQGLGEGTQGD